MMIKPAFLPQEPSFIPAPQIISQPIQTEQLIPAEQFLRGEPIFRSEPLIRSEQIIRTEPLIRREPIIRAPQIIRNEPIFQNGPVFPSESAPYTIMVTPCQCSHPPPPPPPSPAQPCLQNFGQAGSQETFFPLSSQFVPQTFIPQRITFQKPIIKPTIIQPVVLPKIQRFIRKGFRPITEKVQISSVPVQLPVPVSNPQEISATFNTEPIQFTSNMNNFQNPAPVQEHTPDPLTTPVTPRSPVPQAPNRFPIPQVSSIC